MAKREFDRDIYSIMTKWKDDCAKSKIALEIRGARQIGKTHSIQKFIADNFRKAHELNMFIGADIEHVEMARGRAERTKGILGIVSELFPDFEDNPDVVLFFDEIQESSYLYNLIRPINRELKCRLILSGSFPGHTLNKTFITPTGDIKTVRMYSLSFAEFMGTRDGRDLYESADLFGKSEPGVYDCLRSDFLVYLQTGGHPKVVERVLNENSLDFVEDAVSDIVSTFYNESKRYFTDILDVTRFRDMLIGMASLLLRDRRGNINTPSELGKIIHDSTKQSILRSLSWFYESGIVEPCNRVNDCDWANVTPSCRYYFSDIGIADYFYKQVPLRRENIYGELCESFAYSCIRDMSGQIQKTPHFATFGHDELDYIFAVRSGGKIVSVGVEVKGGKGASASALRLLEKGHIDYLINAKLDTYGGISENIFTIPLPLLGRFNIFDYIPNDDEIERGKLQAHLVSGRPSLGASSDKDFTESRAFE